MRPINRISPALPAQDVRTFSIRSPLATHTRAATCAEVDCEAWRGGWVTMVDEATTMGQRQAAYIRSTAVREDVTAAATVRLAGARRYSESRDAPQGHDGAHSGAGVTSFTFPPGTECFAEHRVPTARPELFIVKDGDWRGNPRGSAPRQHSSPDHWVEEFADHQDRLAAVIERG